MPTIKTFRAKSLPDAIAQIRQELGPDASLLHTREVGGGLLNRLLGRRGIEVAASAEVIAPSRFALPDAAPIHEAVSAPPLHESQQAKPQHAEPQHTGLENTGLENTELENTELQEAAPQTVQTQNPRPHHSGPQKTEPLAPSRRFDQPLDAGPTINKEENPAGPAGGLTDALFAVFTDLIEADVAEPLARRLLDDLRGHATPEQLEDANQLRTRLRTAVEQRFTTSGPITTGGGRRLVALVGPTGVGKTTTIAKLAANFRLREGLRVGLITVDTYRVAAVDQLRTYADIMDLPMEVVSTPREMREAVDRLANLDLVLLDTAGRSPRDEVRLQELKSMLAEAAPDEVHLVLSTTAGARQLSATAENFQTVGVTSLLLTKTDEAAALGHLVSLSEETRLPISYTTNGQNVPDDIAIATPASLAGHVLN